MEAVLQMMMCGDRMRALEMTEGIKDTATRENSVRAVEGATQLWPHGAGGGRRWSYRAENEKRCEQIRTAELAATNRLGITSVASAAQGPATGGSRNLGNTCYANAVALLLASSSAANMICAMAEDGIHECARAYGRWLSELVNGGRAVPHRFFTEAGIDATRQHDAQEFLVTLLDCLAGWSPTGKCLHRAFRTVIATERQCTSCGHGPTNFGHATEIILRDIRKHSTLEEALRDAAKVEMVEGRESPLCERCNERIPSRRRELVCRAAENTVFVVGRFRYDQRTGRERIPGWFSFPLALLLANTRLELVGYISHRGVAARGHYVWTRRQGFEFYEHDDAAQPRMTGRAKGGRMTSDDVYILLYSAHERHRRSRDEEMAERLAPRDNTRPPDRNTSRQPNSGGAMHRDDASKRDWDGYLQHKAWNANLGHGKRSAGGADTRATGTETISICNDKRTANAREARMLKATRRKKDKDGNVECSDDDSEGTKPDDRESLAAKRGPHWLTPGDAGNAPQHVGKKRMENCDLRGDENGNHGVGFAFSPEVEVLDTFFTSCRSGLEHVRHGGCEFWVANVYAKCGDTSKVEDDDAMSEAMIPWTGIMWRRLCSWGT